MFSIQLASVTLNQCLKKMKIVNEFQHLKVSNMMISISRNFFNQTFHLFLLMHLIRQKAFQTCELNLKHEQMSNRFIIGGCILIKYSLLMPFQQTN